MYKAIIFDFDGTLADTLPVCIAAFQTAYRKHLGRDYTDAEIEQQFGPTEEGAIRTEAPDVWEACLETYYAEYEKEHASLTAPFPGIIDLLDYLRSRGVRTAIVTGKGDVTARISLDRLGLAGHVDLIEAGSPDRAIKPAKITAVLHHWGIAPEDAVYIGDAPADIPAAREAGVTAIAASWAPGANHDTLSAAKPDALFTRVADLRRWIEERI